MIKAYDIPKYKYDLEKKKYIIDKSPRSLLPSAKLRSEFLIDRYTMLWQRTNRHELFSAAIAGVSNDAKKFKLRKIENLLSTSSMDEIVVLGLLAKLTETKFFIEDSTGSVPLDLSNVQYHSGFFCEGCFVLIEGNYSDGSLRAVGMGFPPVEAADSSRAYFGSLNTWGGRSTTLLKASPRLLEYEQSNTEATIVFLSDCWLDDQTVFEKLQVLFDGYNEMAPTAIVLMGPFLRNLSNPFTLKIKLTALAEFISTNCPTIKKKTDIILVPALEDPAAPVIMPRPPLPEKLCADAKRLLPRLLLATNPCRLQYCTQQIVVCRADLITKLCRNTINFPQTGKLEDHVSRDRYLVKITWNLIFSLVFHFMNKFARTLISQGALVPLSQNTLPIYWDYDCALSLYPLPDLVVIGDTSKAFEISQQGCQILNIVRILN